jgi:tryptophan halogenase
MKIVIVGGGTAGWIAAYCLNVAQPNKHDVTVIESSKIGIIGAGEGSTGILHDLLTGRLFGDAGLDIADFMQKTDSTSKFGILHQYWDKGNNQYFAPIDGSISYLSNNDFIFKYVLQKFGHDQFHLSSKLGMDYELGIPNTDSAFHFDGHKVGQFFKSYCVKHNVKVIDSVVQQVNLNERGHVSSLLLEDELVVDGDFFFDCTGFSRLIMNAVDSKWISYKKYLPVDSAMPFIVKYKNNENVLPVTTATALSSGWMWNIPLLTRRGCGYVFDSNYISKEQAQQEIETHLNAKIEPIKFINFTSGRSDNFWKNNVLSLGLASSFVEPLEATSIHSTIVQIHQFITEFLTPDAVSTITEENSLLYNKNILDLFESIFNFISLHYQGGKENSEFWRDIKHNQIVTDYTRVLLERSKNKILGNTIFETHGPGTPGAALWNWVLAGMRIIGPEQARKELLNSGLLEKAQSTYIEFFNQYKLNLEKSGV